MLLRLAAGIVILCSFLTAQGGETNDVRVEGPERRAKEGQEKGDKSRGQKGDIGEEENLTPEQKLARNVTSGASAYCRFLATVTPAKLMPGQSGTLRVLATLQGHAVLPAPPPFQVLSQPQHGAISVGPLTPHTAEAGKLEKGYLGRPVYENYAVFEAPVTMAADAVLGSKHAVAIDMQFDLYDGGSAQVIGRYLDRVSTEVEVGRSLDPEVKMPVRNTTASEPVKPEAPVEPASVSAPTPAPGDTKGAPLGANVVIPEAAAPAPSPEPKPSTDTVLPVEVEGDGIPVPLLIGGGVLLLAVILLLARKK